MVQTKTLTSPLQFVGDQSQTQSECNFCHLNLFIVNVHIQAPQGHLHLALAPSLCTNWLMRVTDVN